MAAIPVAVFLASFLSVFSAEIVLEHVCIMNDGLADCTFTDKGVYGSSAVDRTSTRIQFNRLPDSVINLANLPEVGQLFIDADPYDQRRACSRITQNTRPVSVYLGDERPVLCPPIDRQTTETIASDKTEPSATEGTRDRQTLPLKTKLAEVSVFKEDSTMEADTTVEDMTLATPQDLNAYIIIPSSLSAFIIIIIIVAVICYLCHKCKRRQQQSLNRMELGVRFGGLSRSSSSEETVFGSSKID